MIREIVRDEFFLSRRSADATADDLELARDLADTLLANRERCVGMAANMIGAAKRIIAFFDGGRITVMFNPEIIKKSGPYEAEEGCLSLEGRRSVRRWQTIKVRWQNERFEPRVKNYSGFTAEIIQHEIDHCEGVVI